MKSGIILIITAVVLFIVGVVCVPLAIVKTISRESVDLVQFKVPGTAMAFVDAPGRYYVWHDYDAIYEGQSYRSSTELPNDLKIELIGTGGVPLEFVSDSSTNLTLNNHSRKSVGYVEVPEAGQVTIKVNGDVERVLFSFSAFSFGHFFGLIVKGVICAGVSALLGLGLMIWGIVKWVKSSKKTSSHQ
jgi:hypothetical protein